MMATNITAEDIQQAAAGNAPFAAFLFLSTKDGRIKPSYYYTNLSDQLV